MNEICISDLFQAVDINHKGFINVNESMSGLEANPKDDWLYLGLMSFKKLSENNPNLESAAVIGSGNGIDAIALLKLFNSLKTLCITDLVEEILPLIKENIERNIESELNDKEIYFKCGRDCEPLDRKFDLIYANLPLLMVDGNEMKEELSPTTLTDLNHYSSLKNNGHSSLHDYSLLSQLGFLLSAKEKLNKNGFIVTLIGGRIPYAVIQECFKAAGLKSRQLYCSFMNQSDPEFLKQYAEYEKNNNLNFTFYDYEKASQIILKEFVIQVPDIIDSSNDNELKALLSDAEINAGKAWSQSKKGFKAGHIAYAFLAQQ